MSKLRSADVRRELFVAPSTSMELQAILGMTSRDMNVALWYLQTIKHVEKDGTVPHPDYPGVGRHNLFLYKLTPRGRHFVKRRTYEKYIK